MKKIILVGDGMGDYPVPKLGNQTPLQAASIPTIRKIAAKSFLHMVQTIPQGMQPGSDVANLGLLGYDPTENYTGRAPIEAAGASIPMKKKDIAFRCNLVTVEKNMMEDYSSGHITTEEAHQLIDTIQETLGHPKIQFHGGVSYRHLLIWENGPTELTTEPPHEISGKPIVAYLPQGHREEEIRELMEASKERLANHPVNQARIRSGKKPATQIWLWGQGHALTLSSYQDLHGLTGGVVSAVDLIRGLGRLAGLKAPIIPNATGFIDTNYQGKVQAGLEILKHHDFAYIHIEAPDECGHMGDAELKTEAIEAFDKEVVNPVWKGLEEKGEPYRLIICMDHRTPVSLRGHTAEPVPLAILNGPSGPLTEEIPFDETLNDGKANAISHETIQKFLA
ncbi:MAG: cofactor-independent phosphoglycerate mutase [Kiritimatiellae bacterium]|nr:cofactor-independent phosphoglycerate mutase [Kiritimatiellia bacterium]